MSDPSQFKMLQDQGLHSCRPFNRDSGTSDLLDRAVRVYRIREVDCDVVRRPLRPGALRTKLVEGGACAGDDAPASGGK